jgi:regulatory protein
MTDTPKTFKKRLRSARNSMMDYLARRDHSELELRTKLAQFYPPDEIEKALNYAKDRGWLNDPDRLSAQMADYLHRKQKGLQYINHFLKKKGLPPVSKDRDLEIEKARECVAKKIKNSQNLQISDKSKLVRFLASRGFDPEVIMKALSHLRFSRTPLSDDGTD